MLNIKTFVCNMLQENCHVVSDESGEAVVIDCGAYFDDERQAIVDYIRRNQLRVVHLLCTHGHFDHCFGNDTIWREFGVKPEIAAEDAYLCNIDEQMRDMLGTGYNHESAPILRFFEKDEVVKFGTHSLQVLPTPGHTPGGVCFYCAEEHVVFTGDTLFYMSVGRTDFDGGSWNQLVSSLRNVLAKLPADTVVYSGHGPKTSIGAEVRNNPYMGSR